MLIYLDNCCYNRPFDEQAQVRVRLETEAKLRVQAMKMRIEEYDLCAKGLTLLMENLGNVEAERFVALMNQGAGDYTEWRREHLFLGEDLHTLAKRARETGDVLRTMAPTPSDDCARANV